MANVVIGKSSGNSRRPKDPSRKRKTRKREIEGLVFSSLLRHTHKHTRASWGEEDSRLINSHFPRTESQ